MLPTEVDRAGPQPRARTRISGVARWLIPLGGAWLAASGCARELEGVQPPEQAFYYPIDVQPSPVGPYAYVVSSDFDLQYNTGWVSAVDLGRVLDQVEDGVSPDTSAIVSRVKVPPLGARVGISPDGTLALAPQRGQGTVSVIQISDDGAVLSCGDADAQDGLSTDEEQTDCDRDHIVRLSGQQLRQQFGDLSNDGEEILAEEMVDPYPAAVFLHSPDSATDDELLAAVGTYGELGYMGRILLFDVDPTQSPFLVPRGSPSARNPGFTGIAVHPEQNGRFLLAINRNTVVESIEVRAPGESEPVVATSLNTVAGNQDSAGNLLEQLVGLSFNPDGRRAYVTSRRSDSLVVLDTTLVNRPVPDEPGTLQLQPRLAVLDVVTLPGSPGDNLFVQRPNGNLIFVTSFDQDAVDVLVPQEDSAVLVFRLQDAGNGPFGLAHVSLRGRELLLVTTFFDNGLIIYDITDPEPARFERLGQIRSTKVPEGERAR